MKVIIDIPKEAFELVKSDEPIDFLDAMHIISTIQNGIPLEEELEKIIDKIDFEEKWLINIKMENGFIAISDIQMAMSAIRSVASKLNESKECGYFDSEVETCRRSEAEFDELNNLYYGMTESMQKAVKDIMLVANGKDIEE